MKAVCILLCLALVRFSAGNIFRSRQGQPEMQNLIVSPAEYIQYEEQLYKQLQRQNQPQRSRTYSQYRESEEVTEQKQQLRRQQPQQQRMQDQHQEKYQQQNNQYQQQNNLYKQEKNQYQQVQKQYQQVQKQYQQASQESQESQESQQYKQKLNQYQTQQNQQKQNQQESKEYQQELKQYVAKKNQHQQELRQYQSEEKQSQEEQRRQLNSNEQRENRHRGHQHATDSTSNESNSQETRTNINEYVAHHHANVKTMQGRRTVNRDAIMEPLYADPIVWKNVKIAMGPKSTANGKDIEKIFGAAAKTMQQVTEEDKKIFNEAYEKAAAVITENEDAQLNATELLRKNQYNVEEHTIKTDDGYYLTLFRIPPKDLYYGANLVQKPVVFLMHGLLGSADDWLLMGPGKSLAYLLADAGYDVWLGNARGSKYSRQHVSKHPAQADFWQYSNDEIALQDLPAMIDFALKTSNQDKLFYVAHSQGTTAFFALASVRPEYNDKIIMMYALSPMAYTSNVRSPMLRMIAPTSPFSERLHQQLGHGRFMPSKELVRTVGGDSLAQEIGNKEVSSNVNFVMSGVSMKPEDAELIPVIMRHLPAGASARQINQYAQGVASHDFTKYDFGAEMNQKVYGQPEPPKYDVSKVRVPVALYYSAEDWMAHPRDVATLQKQLPNVKDAYQVPVQHFTHMDFQFSKKAPQVVYKRLINSIQKEEERQQKIVETY